MGQTFDEIDVANRDPRVAIEHDTKQGVKTTAPNDPLVLLIGQRLATGNKAANEVFAISREFDAEDGAGRASILHLMAIAAFKCFPGALVYGVGIADAGGAVKATETLIFAVNAANDSGYEFDIGNDTVAIDIVKADTPTVMGDRLVAAVAAMDPPAPITGANVAGTVTWTARNGGETGKFGTFDRFANVKADAEMLDRKFQLNASSGLGRIKASEIAIQRSTDKNLGGGIDMLAQNSNLVSGAYDFATAHPFLVGGGALAAILGRSALQRRFGGAGAGGGLGGGVLDALSGAGMPVRVVNWPGGLGGGMFPGSFDFTKNADGASKALGTFGTVVNNAGILVTTFGAAFAAGTWLDQKLGLSDKLSGTAAGNISARENAQAETGGGRASRELGIAKDVAKSVKSGKLTGRAAARQFAGFSRNLEHVKDASELSNMALLLMDQLERGDAGGISSMTEEQIRNEEFRIRGRKDTRAEAIRARLGDQSRAEFGPQVQSLSDPSAAASLVPAIVDAIKQGFGEAQLNMSFDGDGNLMSSDSSTGARAPKVMVRRSVGG